MAGFGFGLLSLALAVAALLLWMRRMNAVGLSGRRVLPYALFGAGIVFGAFALARGPGWIGGAFAVFGAALGLIWIGLGLLSRQSRQIPNLALGEPLPAIVAPDHTGAPFAVESLRGHPVLIKLFRGHW